MVKAKLRAFLLCMMAACVLFNGCRNKQDQILEAKLRARINEFYACLSNEEYDKAWLMLSPEQRENIWQKETWVNMQKSILGMPRLKLESIEIKKIRLARNGEKLGALANIMLYVKIIENANTRVEKIPWQEGWTFKNGEWYRMEGD